MSKNNYNFYLDVAERSLKNAGQFIKESKLLQENKSFGHAYSFTVLGLEELMKTWGAFYLYVGYYQKNNKIVKDLFGKSHITRHNFSKEIFALITYRILEQILHTTHYDEKLPEIDPTKTKFTQIDFNAFNESYINIIRELSQDKNHKNEALVAEKILVFDNLFEEINLDESILDKNKNNGFYLDISFDEKRVRNDPNEFSIKEDDVFVQLTNLLFEITEYLMNGIQQIKDNPQFQTMLQNFRKSFPLFKVKLKKKGFFLE